MSRSARPVQIFTDEHLERGRRMKGSEIVEFLEGFREMAHASAPSPSRLISVRVPESLLESFKFAARQEGLPYQTLLKRLMREYLGAAEEP
jgi:predicted DNA binding CopG/RHH family protein